MNLKPAYDKAMSMFGVRPNFLIIGTQKGGTTSLYQYLIQHPCVSSSLRKEIHYFDRDYAKGESWYKRQFRLNSIKKQYLKAMKGHTLITGEATPAYIFYPHAPKRVFQLIPEAKIIVMLRDPVDRAFSHYQHHVKLKVEPLPFEEAIDKEASRLQGEFERMTMDGTYYSASYYNYSYLARGLYVDQVRRWLALFPREQVLFIKSEDFFHNTSAVFRETLKFLGLPIVEVDNLTPYNVGKALDMTVAMRRQLSDYFLPHNLELYEYLNRDFGWSCPTKTSASKPA